MPKETKHTRIPLEQFFIRLENAGFEMNTARKLRLLSALEQKGATFMGDFEKLKYFLAPLIARNDKEQKQFYDLFDEFCKECKRQSEIPPKPIEEKKEKNTLPWKWLLALLPFIIFLLWYFGTQAEAEFKEIRLQSDGYARAGEILDVNNLTPVKDTFGFIWEVKELNENKIVHKDSSFNLHWKVDEVLDGADLQIVLSTNDLKKNWSKTADTATVYVQCANPPIADTILFPDGDLVKNRKYYFEIKTTDILSVEWYFLGKDTMTGHKVSYKFKEEGEASIGLLLFDPNHKTQCYSTLERNLVIGNDRPYLALESLTLDEPRLTLKTHSWVWILLLLILSSIIAFLFLYPWLLKKWREEKKQEQKSQKTITELEAENPIDENAPFYIPYQSSEDAISIPADFYRMADVLRRREEGQRKNFDVKGSVKATIDAGTFPTWRDRLISRPVDYIVFCHMTDERQQQDKLFRRLTEFLIKQETPITVFYHDDDFEHFWNDQNPDGISLDLIYRTYPYHRLILLGNAHALINPYHPQKPALLKKPMDIIEHWSRRLILTDECTADWSFQEVLLYRNFLLYPADTRGIREGLEKLDQIEEYKPGRFDNWQEEQCKRRPDLTARRRDWLNVEELKDYLKQDKDVFRWLCALAVAPSPDWTLTIRIARALGIEVTHDRLLLLTRITWLADNETPFDLRLDLIRLLSKEDELLARQAVAEELEKVEDKIQNSFAALEWKNNKAVQYFAINPFNVQHKKILQELIQLGLLSDEQMEELDFIVQERTDHTGVPTTATTGITAWLDQYEEIPFFNRIFASVLLLLMLSIVSLFFAWSFDQKNKELKEGETAAFWQQVKLVDDDALRLHNQAIRIGQNVLAKENVDKWDRVGDSLNLAFYSLDSAIDLRKPTPYLLADSNRLNLRYNQSVKDFNFFLSDTKKVGKLLSINEDFAELNQDLLEDDKSLQLKSLHAYGLTWFYLSELDPENKEKRASTQFVYEHILKESEGQFFERIKKDMPINLQTLLAKNTSVAMIQSLKISLNSSQRLKAIATYVLPESMTKGVTAKLEILTADGKMPLGFKTLVRKASADKESLSFDIKYRPQKLVQTDSIAFWLEKNGERIATKTIAYKHDWNKVTTPLKFLTVNGQILDQDNKPLAKAKIELIEDLQTQEARSPYRASAFSNAKGFFELKIEVTVTNSDYLLRVSSPDCKTKEVRKKRIDLKQQQIVILNCTPSEQTSFGDKDNDGIADTSDNCIGISNPDQADFDKDGKGDVCDNDDDNDGIIDADDDCPQTPPKIIVDEKGCELTAQSPSIDTYKIITTIGTNMDSIPAGTFTMGCTEEQGDDCQEDEKPAHQVELSSFQISKYEVTQAEWRAVMGSDPEELRFKGCDKCPVEGVSWNDIQDFLKKLNEKTGKNYRLPTEAEWEYAARGGENYKYAGSDDIDEVAWYDENSNSKTYPVGGKKNNGYGLYDMSGNVYEWCSDWYGETYYNECKKQGVVKNPKGAYNGSYRVIRGGSWNFNAAYCRVSNRNYGTPANRYYFMGFRLARS